MPIEDLTGDGAFADVIREIIARNSSPAQPIQVDTGDRDGIAKRQLDRKLGQPQSSPRGGGISSNYVSGIKDQADAVIAGNQALINQGNVIPFLQDRGLFNKNISPWAKGEDKGYLGEVARMLELFKSKKGLAEEGVKSAKLDNAAKRQALMRPRGAGLSTGKMGDAPTYAGPTGADKRQAEFDRENRAKALEDELALKAMFEQKLLESRRNTILNLLGRLPKKRESTREQVVNIAGQPDKRQLRSTEDIDYSNILSLLR